MDLAEYLLPQPPEDRGSWRWATVTAVSPLRVRLDGDSTALVVTPDVLGPVRVGDRVRCQIVDGHVTAWSAWADTGWLTLTLASGYETKSGTPRYRRVGGRVYLSGLVGPTSGTFTASTSAVIATLPTGFRPAQSEWSGAGTTTGQATATLVIVANGEIQARIGTTNTSYVGLGDVNFFTD